MCIRSLQKARHRRRDAHLNACFFCDDPMSSFAVPTILCDIGGFSLSNLVAFFLVLRAGDYIQTWLLYH